MVMLPPISSSVIAMDREGNGDLHTVLHWPSDMMLQHCCRFGVRSMVIGAMTMPINLMTTPTIVSAQNKAVDAPQSKYIQEIPGGRTDPAMGRGGSNMEIQETRCFLNLGHHTVLTKDISFYFVCRLVNLLC